jgi:hypothetical protein
LRCRTGAKSRRRLCGRDGQLFPGRGLGQGRFGKCLACHRKGGDAEESKFILVDPRKSEGTARDKAMRENRAAFTQLASVKENDRFRTRLPNCSTG